MRLTHAHVRVHHHVTLSVVGTSDISISLSALDTSMNLGVHDRISLVDVLVVVTVATQRVGSPFTLVAHVAIQVTIISLHHVLCRGSQGRHHANSDRNK